MVNFCCSGYPSRPMIWLSVIWVRMGQAIDRTETESSAVLLCRAGHTVRQLNRCSALGQPSLFALSVHTFTTLCPFHLLQSMFHYMTISQTPKSHIGRRWLLKMSLMAFNHKCPWVLVWISVAGLENKYSHTKRITNPLMIFPVFTFISDDYI